MPGPAGTAPPDSFDEIDPQRVGNGRYSIRQAVQAVTHPWNHKNTTGVQQRLGQVLTFINRL